ncbi:hypothetical protein GOODEAATRI_007650 [Goodea atripinnis]|uniref:Uncharacterized protein n=1 Tax=Goodea atripinnis TaxID=208336 RepID=A0ABV0NSL1_9TELE
MKLKLKNVAIITNVAAASGCVGKSREKSVGAFHLSADWQSAATSGEGSSIQPEKPPVTLALSLAAQLKDSELLVLESELFRTSVYLNTSKGPMSKHNFPLMQDTRILK